MTKNNQKRLGASVLVGFCVFYIYSIGKFRLINNDSAQTASVNIENLTPTPKPTSIPGIEVVHQQAYSENAWDCGLIKSIVQTPDFNNSCATTAWAKKKLFRLKLNWYDPHYGSYAGYLIGDRKRHLYLSIEYSTVNGIWTKQKEIKGAFIAKKNGKSLLYWQEQQQDLGVNLP